MANGQGSAGNVISALASFFIPGLGQLLQGRLVPAMLFFVLVVVCYALWFLILPPAIGFILHIWCILNAALWKPR